MRTSTRNISIQGRDHASKKQYSTRGLRGDMFGQAGIPRGKEDLWNRPRTIQKDPTKGGNSPFCCASPIAFRKRGRDTSGEILEDLHALFQGRPDLFLSHEEYKVLVGTPKTARHSTPSSIYGTSLDNSANSIDSNTTTSLPSDMYKTSRRCECTQGTRLAL